MIINPEYAIGQQWVTHPKCKTLDDWRQLKLLNPNAIDFTVDSISRVISTETFAITERDKVMRDIEYIEPIYIEHYDNYCWQLYNDSCYDAVSDMYINVPEGIACELIIRSTLSRNGITMSSGLYDSGYHGHIGCTLHSKYNNTYIGEGTRIGQVKFIVSDSAGTYQGQYNHAQDQHWHDNTK